MLAYKEGHPLAVKKRKEWDFMVQQKNDRYFDLKKQNM